LPPRSPLSPYTTLFRSPGAAALEFLPRGETGLGGEEQRHEGLVGNRDAGAGVAIELGRLRVLALHIEAVLDGGQERQEAPAVGRSEEHTSELQSRENLV